MMICQATGEKTSTSQCRKTQREVLVKFCQGCSWHRNSFITRGRRLSGDKTATKKKSHKILLSGYIREFILGEAGKAGISGSQMITRLLGELAHERRHREDSEEASI